jgi:hypothetical protein
MKITKSQLRRIIREEIQIVRERYGGRGDLGAWRDALSNIHDTADQIAYGGPAETWGKEVDPGGDQSWEAALARDRSRFGDENPGSALGSDLYDAVRTKDPSKIYTGAAAGDMGQAGTIPAPRVDASLNARNVRAMINDLSASGKIDRDTKIRARRALYNPDGDYDPAGGLPAVKAILKAAGVLVR